MLAAAVTAALAYQLHAPAFAPAAAVRRASHTQLVEGMDVEGDKPMTIGAAKDGFFAAYGRPVNSMQQQFVNEMLTGSTLAFAKSSYKPSRVFYLGFVNLCDVFLAGAKEGEQETIFNSLCSGLALDPVELRKESEALKKLAEGKTEEELLASADLQYLKASGMSYSYPLGSGLLTLMPLVGVEVSDAAITRWCTAVFASATTPPANTLQKDWAFYKDAQRRLDQTQQMFLEMAAAAKRKEAKALQEKAAAAAKEAEEAEGSAA